MSDAVDMDQLEDWNLWTRYTLEDDFVMVDKTTSKYRVPADPETLRAEALEWATTRGSRSGRVAWQYVQDLAGRLGVTLLQG